MLAHSDERLSDVASVHRRYNVLIRRTVILIIIVGNEIKHAKDKENIALHWALVENVIFTIIICGIFSVIKCKTKVLNNANINIIRPPIVKQIP